MFGFFSAEILNEAAVLMERANLVFRDYAVYDFHEARDRVRQAYGESAYVGDEECNFYLGDFQFMISKSANPAKVAIIGKGRYYGLLVQTTDGEAWIGQASDGVAGKCTRDAKRMLAALGKHHSVFDYGRALRTPNWMR